MNENFRFIRDDPKLELIREKIELNPASLCVGPDRTALAGVELFGWEWVRGGVRWDVVELGGVARMGLRDSSRNQHPSHPLGISSIRKGTRRKPSRVNMVGRPVEIK